ncbi:MAG: type pilus assembly protein PilB [Candidatus Binatota bacterium]|nr:type pilus assembly protein PilB [Candidatus Binatota bacterium]
MSRLGELLLRRNLITQEQLTKAVTEQQQGGGILAVHLVRLGFITEDQLAAQLQKEYRLPIIDPMSFEVSPEGLQLLPYTLANKHHVLPISIVGSTLTIAMADPSNLVGINEVKFLTGFDVKVVLAPAMALKKGIERFYDVGSASYDDVLNQLESDNVEFVRDEQDVDVKELERATEEAPVVKLVNAILTDAIKRRASDVHVEPFEKMMRVRFRVDGVLYEVMKPPLKLRSAFTSRIKIMSQLDIAERRLPQDGRIKLRLPGGKDMDFRVSVLPTIFGEKIVLRLLDKSNLQLDMTKLGFEEEQLKHFKDAIAKPFGMLLVTGPTGSGKTTTLYSALSELNKITENISTCEDPVEFNLVGINQVQINEDIGLTFAAALRSFLRQDPDVIMVGEVRDFETAEIAIKAALTGHLVLSTLHTNDAPSTINRLLNMGIEPFLVASSINIIVAQRLARQICVHCKAPAEYPPEVLREVGFNPDDTKDLIIMQGRGCNDCGGSGYRGRIALYEALPMNDDIREGVLVGASALEIKRKAITNGMKTLRASGLQKVRQGVTTIEEVVRVTIGD